MQCRFELVLNQFNSFKTNCMTKTITQDNLVLYIYHETSTHEALLIEEALQSDWELKELHYSLLEGKVELDGIITSPRPKVIDDILRYSRYTAPMEHTM